MPLNLTDPVDYVCNALKCDTCLSVMGVQNWQACALDFEYTLLHMCSSRPPAASSLGASTLP